MKQSPKVRKNDRFVNSVESMIEHLYELAMQIDRAASIESSPKTKLAFMGISAEIKTRGRHINHEIEIYERG